MFAAGIPDPIYCQTGLSRKHCSLPPNAEELAIINTVTSSTSRYSVVRQDANTLVNKLFEKKSSERRCFFWSDDPEAFLCGPVIVNKVGNLNILHFCNRDRGVWPEEMISHFDRRLHVALFFSTIQKELRAGMGRETDPFEFGVSLLFLDQHEIAHHDESYFSAHFFEEARTQWGWTAEYDFDLAVREILADLKALKKIAQEHETVQSVDVQLKDAFPVYRALRHRSDASTTYIRLRDRFAQKLQQQAMGSDKKIDFVQWGKIIDQEIQRFEKYLTNMEQYFKPIKSLYLTAAQQEAMKEEHFRALGSIIRSERVTDVIISMLLQNGKNKLRGAKESPHDQMRDLVRKEMQRLAIQ